MAFEVITIDLAYIHLRFMSLARGLERGTLNSDTDSSSPMTDIFSKVDIFLSRVNAFNVSTQKSVNWWAEVAARKGCRTIEVDQRVLVKILLRFRLNISSDNTLNSHCLRRSGDER